MLPIPCPGVPKFTLFAADPHTALNDRSHILFYGNMLVSGNSRFFLGNFTDQMVVNNLFYHPFRDSYYNYMSAGCEFAVEQMSPGASDNHSCVGNIFRKGPGYNNWDRQVSMLGSSASGNSKIYCGLNYCWSGGGQPGRKSRRLLTGCRRGGNG